MDKEVTVFIYTHTMLPFTIAWVDVEGIMFNKMSDRKRQMLLSLICESKKIKQTSEYKKTITDSQI